MKYQNDKGTWIKNGVGIFFLFGCFLFGWLCFFVLFWFFVKSRNKTIPQEKSNLEFGLKEKFLHMFWTWNSGGGCEIVMFFRGDIAQRIYGAIFPHWNKWEACSGLQWNLNLVMNNHTLHRIHILWESMTKIF